MALDLRPERYGSKALPKGAEAKGGETTSAAKPVKTGLDLRPERYGSKALPKGAEATGDQTQFVKLSPYKFQTLNTILSNLNNRWNSESSNTKWRSIEDRSRFRQNFEQERQSIRDILDEIELEYGYDDEELLTNLEQIRAGVDSYDLDSLESRWSQWHSQQEYEQYLDGVRDWDEKRNLDLATAEKELAALEVDRDEYVSLSRWMQDEKGNARLQQIREKYGSVDDLETLIDQKRQGLTQAKRIQEQEAGKKKYSEVKKNADFAQNSGYDSSRKDIGYQYVNADEEQRLELEQQYGQYAENFGYNAYDSLTEDEKEIYNYFMNTRKQKEAAEYLKYLQETLNQRKGQQIYEDGYQDHLLHEYAFGIDAGLDQFRSGVQGMGNLIAGRDDYVAPSAKQYASGMMREDLADKGWKLPSWLGGTSIGQIGYDAITTTANMAPSIAVGLINPVAGSVTLGASAAGSAYQEAINEGYSVDQARGYGILSGASEIIMEKLLGGISAYGGNALGKFFTQNMKNADTALKQIAKELGGSMLSEFSEEYLQEVLTPVFQNLTLDTDNEVKLVSAEAIYSGILGAITGGIMEGPQAIMKGRSVNQAPSNATELAKNATDTVDNTTEPFDNTTEPFDNATPALEKSTHGGVTEESSAADDKMSETGESAENAHSSADVSEKVVGAENATTTAEAATSKNSLQVGQEAEGTVSNPERVDSAEKVTSHKRAGSARENTTKAVQISTGESVDITRISAVDKNGGMTFQLSDGRYVDAGDIQYGSDGEAVLYEAVADLGASAEVSDILVNNWKNDPGGVSAESYAAGMLEAFNYGRYHIPASEMAQNAEIAKLTSIQSDSAYALGKAFGSELVQTKEANIRRAGAVEKAQKASRMAVQQTVTGTSADNSGVTATDAGKVHFDQQGRTLSAVQETGLKTMEQLSQLFGTEFHVFESYEKDGKRVFQDENGVEQSAPNGWYDPKTGHIHIDLNAGSGGRGTMLFTVAHELTHFIRDWSPAKFDKLAEAVFELVYKEKNISVVELVRKQQAKAARNGMELTFDEAYEEVVADSMESILTSGNVVALMAELKQQDQSLWQKIRKWFQDLAEDIRKLIDSYAGFKPDSAEGRAVAAMEDVLPILEGFYMDALQEASGNYQSAAGQNNTTQEGGRKNSFAGRESVTADRSALQQAEQMQKQGADNETIRLQTGWFRGMDGKWRFEIDDSQMEISENISNYMRLGDLMQHEKLYAAYPDLADIDVVFQSLDAGVSGSYHPQFDSINLSYKLKHDPIGLKDALVHELQHAVQQREGFTKGATAESWERKKKAGYDSRRAADIRKAQETERELRRIQEEEPEFYRDMVELDAMTPDMPRGEIDWETLEKIEDDPVEWQQYDARREELEAKYGDTKVWDMNDLLYQREQAAKNVGRTGVELYFDTAGEIEARDASNRRSKSQEQRKSSPPRLGNEDTVFAEGTAPADDYIPGDVAESELENGIKEVAEMSPISAISGTEFTTEGRTLLDDVDRFFKSVGGQVYNSRLGDINLTRRGVKDSLAHGMTPQKAAAFAAIPDVLRDGKVVGFEKNWKHRGYDSATIVAPITIGGEEYLMAVVVHRSNSANRFYVHDVFTAKKEATPFMTGTQNLGEPGGATSTISIIRKILSVKAKHAEVEKKATHQKQTETDRMKTDQQYLAAVEKGDMKTAQKMVDEAAKQWGAYLNNSEANEVFRQSGEVRTFYHGTNTGDFTVFDKGLLGNSSGDLGWFGKGFYFAFSADEARAYGGRVIHAYLKMKNPYDYSQLYKFKGSDRGSSRYARFAWLYNITKQFPDIVADQKIYAYPNDSEDGKAVSWKQLAGWMDRIEKEAKFSVAQVELSNGDTAWELRANPKQESFTNGDGETFTWTEYGMRQLFATETDAKEPINQIGAYLVNVMGVEPVSRRSIERIDFSGAVQRAGYDGILQSLSGDEAVVFDSSQIKLSDPVTYDDSGSIIPISKRFDSSNSDIRYSQRDPLQEKAVKALEKENAQLKEDVSRLRDLVKLQKKLTGGKMVKPSSVEAAARVLKKTADVTGDTKELAKLLGEFYAYIANGEELTWEGVQEAAHEAADWLWKNRKQTTDEYSAEILKDLRTRGVSFNEDQKSETAVTHDTFANYRKALFGSVKITENGMPLDEAWHELSALYPGVFPEDTNSGDMPRVLVDIVARLRSSDGTYMGYDEIMSRQSLIRDVYDSYWNVSTLYTVADMKQKEINTLKSRHAQRMSDLRTKHREKVEQLHLEQKAAVEAVRAAERHRSQERTRKALDKHRENQKQVAANRAERREKTELRRKIRKAVMELDKLLNRGDKKKNVKDGMSEMVSKSLKLAEALFMDEYSNRDMLRNGVGIQMTDAEEKLFREAQQLMESIESGAVIEGMEFDGEIDAMEQMKKLDSKLSSKMAKLKDVFARERKRLYGTTVSELLGQLADEYSRLSEAEDGAIRAAKDENVYAHLLQLQKDVGGTTVRDMNLNQLEQVADAYTMVLTTVRNANKMFAKNLKFKRDTLAGMVMGEIGAAAKKISKLVSPGKDAADKFSWNNLKPVYAFERLGSQTLKTLFGNIRKGQDVWAVDMQEADAFRRDQYKKHKRKDWDMEKQYSFEFESGKVDLSLEQIMSLYAYSRREAALDHLLKGGFVFGGSTEVFVKKNGIKRRYLKKDATAYNLSAIELMQVIDSLTKEQKAFVEEMQTYLSDVMGGKGNEVSMQMYGIKSFGEKNYFPLRSAGQYMEKAKEDSFRKEQGQISIVNSGFTKATTPHASNPITLDGFMDVWAEHVNDMAMYHGFVLPMEDFRRVYNYSTPNVEEGNSQSVNAAIENAFGKAATGYIDQLYKDLNGGALSDNRENLFRKLVSLHKKAAVFASASVVIQQPSAFVRAFALVDPRHFIGPKVNRQRHKQLWAELKQYAPVAFVKEMGYFDTGMGRSAKDFLQAEEYSGIREKMAALFTDADYRDEVLGKAPALADEYTWCMIWEAVKRETRARNPGLSATSDAFLKIAGERFSEVIDKTQVYDSVLSRSANMRSKAEYMNMLTSFMAEPTTSINMLEDALRKGDRKQIKRTVGAVYGSVLLNSLLVSLVYAARDDDEDETYWEKYLSSVAVEVLDGINPITYYPFLRDIWSVGQGYDVERADMSLITDFANAAKNVISAGQKVQEAAEDEEAAAMEKFNDTLWSMVDSVASLTGLPVKNIRRDIEGARSMYQTIRKDLAGRKTTDLSLQDAVLADVMNAIPIGNLLYSKSKRDQLYGALVAGDATYVQRLRDSYESDAAYHSAIKLALRDNDSRIWEAAVAWNAGDMEAYIRIAKKIRGENRFDQDDIVLAIRAEASTMAEKDGTSASTVNGYFTNEKFGVAMGQNNVSMADTIRNDLIDTLMANGKTREKAEESVRSTARTQLKQLYANDTINGENAEKMLVKYGGYDQKGAVDKVAEWKYEKDFPELDGRITYTQYKRWETDGKSRGIGLDTFTEVAEYQNTGTSGSNRSQEDVADYINQLPISTAQKDALWCCFWKESTLYKAPWH